MLIYQHALLCWLILIFTARKNAHIHIFNVIRMVRRICALLACSKFLILRCWVNSYKLILLQYLLRTLENKWDFHHIKTCPYNFDPLKPHFYTVKLGFTVKYIIFLISAQNIDCRYSLEPPRRGGSNEYPQFMFWAEIWKISEFFIWKFSVLGGEIFYIFE